MPTTAKTPTDHKPKAGSEADGHRFTINGKTYTLPDVSEEQAESLPGSMTMDVVERPDDMQIQARYGFALLRLVAEDEIIDALRSLPTGQMMEIIGGWLNSGESEGSSAQ